MGDGIKFNMPKATPELMFRILLVVFWTQFTILKFVTETIERMPIIGVISDYIKPALFLSLIALSLPYIISRIKLIDFLFYLFVILLILGTLLVYPDSSEYIFEYLWQILGLSVPVYFLGVTYDHEKSKEDLYWGALFGVIAMFAYQLYALSIGRILEADNMSASYNVLPSVMYLIYWAVTNSSIKNWIVAIMASLLPFVFGTRGAILTALIFLGICFIYKIMNVKNTPLKLFLVLLVIGAILYIATGDRILNWAISMSETFGNIGFSTRVFDFIVEDELATSHGRERLTEAVMSAIAQNPFQGYGFMGDRVITVAYGQPYVHNIILEFLCSFGIVGGCLAVLLVTTVPAMAIKKCWDSENVWLLIMFVCLVFIKLLFSGSYVYEPFFYLLLGISVGVSRRMKKESRLILK